MGVAVEAAELAGKEQLDGARELGSSLLVFPATINHANILATL